MKLTHNFFITTALLLCGLCSCEHKDLCYEHPHTAGAIIKVDWSDFVEKETPTGMTVMVYPQDGSSAKTLLSNDIEQVASPLLEGLYDLYVFNQSATEFGSLTFSGMESRQTACVRTGTVTSRWYKTRGDDDRLLTSPEWLGSDGKEGVEVTEEMAWSDEEFVLATLKPQNLVYTVSVTVNAEGLDNVRSARASLSGLADGYMLGLRQPTSTTGTMLLESWAISSTYRTAKSGFINSTIRSFGLPWGHTATAGENTLNLSLLLKDNKTRLDYEFAVGDQFTASDYDDHTLLISVTLPDAIPYVKPAGGSFMDATVDDWGEEKEVDLITH